MIKRRYFISYWVENKRTGETVRTGSYIGAYRSWRTSSSHVFNIYREDILANANLDPTKYAVRTTAFNRV